MVESQGHDSQRTTRSKDIPCMMKVWYAWVRLCTKVNKFFELIFSKWAYICGSYPKTVIGISLLVSLGFMAGFARFDLQNQSERLYFPQNSDSRKLQDRAESTFNVKGRIFEFIILMKNGSTIVNPEAFEAALELHNGILNQTKRLKDICIFLRKPPNPENKDCFYMGALDLVHYNESFITNQNINPNSSYLLDTLNNNNTLFRNGHPASIMARHFLGNLIKTDDKISSNSIRMSYYNKLPETDDFYDFTLPIEQDIIDYFQSNVGNLDAKGMVLEYFTGRSIDDSISESSGGDISLVAAAITLMCVFTTLVLLRVRDPVGGHFWTGMVGIGCVALGIGSGFGITMAGGQQFVAFIGTLPFLILGVGIDDMFIIIGELDQIDPKIRGLPRLQKALGNVGGSITMTTLTDMVAFAVSSSIDFPSIRLFCIYASVCLFLSYVLVVSLLVAYISLDIKRIESGRFDLIPCKKKDGYEPWQLSKDTLLNKIMFQYGKFLMMIPVRIIVFLMYFGLLAAGIYGVYQVEQVFELSQLAVDGSYVISFLDARENYFPTGVEISIINDNANYNYTDPEEQKKFSELDNICLTSDKLQHRTLNWMTAFQTWCNNTTKNANTVNCSANVFYANLSTFLNENPYFRGDIIRDPSTGQIKASRMICWDRDVIQNLWEFRKSSMLELRDTMNSYTEIPGIFAIANQYFRVEQMVIIRGDTIRNLLICALAILVITTPYLVHPLVILFVFAGFVTLVIELFALMAAWNVQLNSISMITSTMSIGFAVDYSAHVAHAYMTSNKDTPEERIIHTLGTIGASVLMGGVTTLLGVCITAAGKSEIFRIFFKMLFGIVILGLLNGLLFLPVLLSVFCRTKLRLTRDDDDYQGKGIPSIKVNGASNHETGSGEEKPTPGVTFANGNIATDIEKGDSLGDRNIHINKKDNECVAEDDNDSVIENKNIEQYISNRNIYNDDKKKNHNVDEAGNIIKDRNTDKEWAVHMN